MKLNYWKNNFKKGRKTNKEIFSINLDKKRWEFSGKSDYWQFDGDYEMDGRILILPIKGKGNSNIKIDNPQFRFFFDYVIENGHMKITNSSINGPLAKVQYNFENLFNGNKQLGDEMNKFMNDNWMEVASEMQPSFWNTLDAVVVNVLSNLMKKVPFEKIFV